MSVIQDHGRTVGTGKWLVGLSLGHSSYQHGLGSGGRGSRRCPILETGEDHGSFLTFGLKFSSTSR